MVDGLVASRKVMRWTLGLTLGLSFLACNVAKKAPAPAPESTTVKYCFAHYQAHDVEQCVGEMGEAQQRRRDNTVRLTYQGKRLIRREFVSGSGALLDTDVEDYQYEGHHIAVVLHTNRNGVPLGKEAFSADRATSHHVDPLGRPKPYEGYSTGTIRRQFDATGHTAIETTLDVQGNPTSAEVDEVRHEYSGSGVSVGWSFYKRGEPVAGWKGAHRVVDELDAHSLARTTRCYGTDGGPGKCRGAHRQETKRDDVGNELEVAYYDAQGQRVRSEGWKAAIVRYVNDERGNRIVTSYFDEHERPTPGPAGCATEKVRYDARDNEIERSCFGVDGAPARETASGVHLQRKTLDARGNTLSCRYLDEDGARMLGKRGYFRLGWEYDARDRLVRETFYGLAEEPVELSDGVATLASEYDAGDRWVRRSYFDVAGKPATGSEGAVRSEPIYDQNGYLEKWRRLDATGQEVVRCEGRATEELQREVHARFSKLRDCAAVLHTENSLVSGTLTVDLRITETGTIAFSRVAKDEIGVPALGECVLGKLRQPYRHGATKSCAWLRVPIRFRGDGAR
jgi:hypothetical protein